MAGDKHVEGIDVSIVDGHINATRGPNAEKQVYLDENGSASIRGTEGNDHVIISNVITPRPENPRENTIRTYGGNDRITVENTENVTNNIDGGEGADRITVRQISDAPTNGKTVITLDDDDVVILESLNMQDIRDVTARGRSGSAEERQYTPEEIGKILAERKVDVVDRDGKTIDPSQLVALAIGDQINLGKDTVGQKI